MAYQNALNQFSNTMYANIFDTNVPAAGLNISGYTIAATGTDANISIYITPKGSNSVVISKIFVSAGNINGTVIGNSSPSTSVFTSSTADSFATSDIVTGLTIANQNITADGTATDIDVSVTPKGTGSVILPKVTISSGTINNTTVGTTIASTGRFTTVTSTARTPNAVAVYSTGGLLSEVGPLTNGQIVIGSTGVAPAASTITAGAGINITNGAGSITITATAAGVTYEEVTTPSKSMVTSYMYGANNAAGVEFTLPVTAGVGSIIQVIGIDGIWNILQNAGQSIHFGNQTTTIGVGGSIDSSEIGDCITMVCIVTDTEFRIISAVGNYVIN